MEKALYTAIKTQIQTYIPEIKFVAMWNNQFDRMQSGEDYSVQLPALFPEFPMDAQCDVVGNNVRVFDPLVLRFHLIDNRIDNMDGTEEENFAVFTLKQKVKATFQLFKCNGSSSFNCTGESGDNDHNNLYHFITDFTTTWVDQQDSLPVGGSLDTPPHTTTITPVITH